MIHRTVDHADMVYDGCGMSLGNHLTFAQKKRKKEKPVNVTLNPVISCLKETLLLGNIHSNLRKDVRRFTPRKHSATASRACGGHGRNQSMTVLFISPEQKQQKQKTNFTVQRSILGAMLAYFQILKTMKQLSDYSLSLLLNDCSV